MDVQYTLLSDMYLWDFLGDGGYIWMWVFWVFALLVVLYCTLQWGAANAEIQVPFGENTELKHSPFKAWSRSVCSHTCYTYCQGFLPSLFRPFWSIHLHFSRVECPRNMNRQKNHMTCGIMTCEMNNFEIEWSLCLALMYSFGVDWAQSNN